MLYFTLNNISSISIYMKDAIPTIDSIREEQLKDRFLAGDDEALGNLYRLFAKDLYSLGLSLQVDAVLIEDAIHDIFEDIYLNRNRLKKVDKVKCYFFTAFRNRLFYLIKREKSQKVKAENYSKSALYETGITENLSISEEGPKDNEIIRKLVRGFSSKQREVIHYRFIEGLSIKEISALMEINSQSVKNLIYRTVKKIEIFKDSMTFFNDKY